MKPLVLILVVAGWVLAACSSQKNTFINRLYHNTTARYNAYYLSKEKMQELEMKIEEEHEEDYSTILPVFYPIDSAVIESNAELLEDARSLASKAIDWHKISNWVDPSYLLLGKIDYYQAEFDEAQNTFKYLNVNSKDKEVRHGALISLLRLFIDLRQFDDAAYVMDYLSKESGISDQNKAYLYKTLAYYYETREEQEMIAPALFKALEFAERKNEISRINFILGQLYQRAGLDAFAYEYYQKSLTGSPSYERTFYAQLFSQQVAELEKSKDLKRVRNYYDDLYKDRKNLEFRDVVLYEKALFEHKQGEIEETVRLLTLAAKEPSENRRQKGYIYEKLADIFLNDKDDYLSTKYYLDSAFQQFKESDKNYAELALKKDIFDRYAANYERITKNDSLIALSKLSAEEQEAYVDEFIAKEEERLMREAELASAKKSTGIFDNLLAFGGKGTGSSFYWENPTAMQRGAIEFVRVWGNRSLTDNWRRTNRSFQERGDEYGDEEGLSEEELALGLPSEEEGEEPQTLNLPDKATLLNNIPKDQSVLDQMADEMEDSYFNLGKILFFELKEPRLALINLNKLVETYPNTLKKPEAYYTMYLATKELNENPEYYAQMLNTEFPESQYTKSINNPDKVSGTQANFESAENYKQAYSLYRQGEYESARAVVKSTLEKYSLSKNTEKLLLLGIMIEGKSGDLEEFKDRLEEFIANAEDTELQKLAQKMLKSYVGESEDPELTEGTESLADEGEEASEDGVEDEGKAEEEDSPYKTNPNQTHIFIISMEPKQAQESKDLTAEFEGFHAKNYPNDRLRTGTISLNRENTIIIISPFSNAEKAMKYRDEFLNSFNNDNLPEEIKNGSFVISIENFQQLNKRKDIKEYKAFFKKAY
ncbi:type IX secretion system periplasmic lipoprotein PorW/SprE [Pleomorphovibrio marinus]|uniref:type IX secretion system periplasmic lipoprotein PorW/SprE n=1 Tax=Pleomorphovibrio marinus TaxID=2164132 RepID=UPI000E0C9EBD|nr:gliding motility protein [Pleomorphovibrio marinus]